MLVYYAPYIAYCFYSLLVRINDTSVVVWLSTMRVCSKKRDETLIRKNNRTCCNQQVE